MDAQTAPNPPVFDRMFLGEFARGIDKKGRLTLPASFRETLGDEEAVITRGLDQCLFLFPKSQFKMLREKIRQTGITSREARKLRRLFFSGAGVVKPDGMGRINLPPYLREYAGLSGDVIIAGVDTYVEIWDAKRWEEEQRPQFEEGGISAESWENLGI